VTAPAAAPDDKPWPRYTLNAEQTWLCNLPHGKAFDASGLLIQPDGALLIEDNNGIGIYRVQFTQDSKTVDLIQFPDCYTRQQLKPFAAEKVGAYDCEGITRDAEGRLYLCEEANRWILRWDPATKAVERLDIDWSSVTNYFSTDRNASFEGIAIGNGKLYVANERSAPVIIVVNLATLKVDDHFLVEPLEPSLLGILHYSDLSWFDEKLWVLCRQHRVVLEVDPKTRQPIAEFKYADLENSLGYKTVLPGVGIMEGLAVDKNFIWLCTDNNGLPRYNHPKDIRPTLIRCQRPDGK
jgi:hypothetical protein